MLEAMTAKVIANLGSANRIPLGEGRQFQIGAVLISVFRTRDGGIYATQASCTHKSGPLADGLVGDRKIVCPLHAYAFDLGSGKPLGHGCDALKTYVAAVNAKGELIVEIE